MNPTVVHVRNPADDSETALPVQVWTFGAAAPIVFVSEFGPLSRHTVDGIALRTEIDSLWPDAVVYERRSELEMGDPRMYEARYYELGLTGHRRAVSPAYVLSVMQDSPTTTAVVRSDATLPSRVVIDEALDIARRAPSIHNSQPWRWSRNVDGSLVLSANPNAELHRTDPVGRQSLLSCGAMLHHLEVAMRSRGWRSSVRPNTAATQFDRLAVVSFLEGPAPKPHDRALLEAIRRRHTDRRAYAVLPDQDLLGSTVAQIDGEYAVTTYIAPESARHLLTELSKSDAAHRRYDGGYQAELRWWAGHSLPKEGIPRPNLVSRAHQEHVGVARTFPSEPDRAPREPVEDHSTVVVVGTTGDTVADWLQAGRAMSALVLECTVRGWATCILTHLTETESSRASVGRMAGVAHPQYLMRIGVGPTIPVPATPRHMVSEFFR